MGDGRRSLLITDLDNTLWDWFDAWHASFSALIDGLVRLSGVDRAVLEGEIRNVHRQRQTTEYSNLLREVPSLVHAASPRDPMEVFDEALHAQNSTRVSKTKLYPTVFRSLQALKKAGVAIVAYTESGAFWTEWRIRRTGLDGLVSVLYSSLDHDVDAGVQPSDLRTGHYSPDKYGLRHTVHVQLPLGVLKPNAKVMETILKRQNRSPGDAVYIGDSLMKDVAMAQAAGVLDVLAQYGAAQNRPEYDLLRRVTHWSAEDVERERRLSVGAEGVRPTIVCERAFGQVLTVFGLESMDPSHA